MENVIQVIRNLGPAKLGAMAGIAVALLGFFLFLMTRLGTPNMALLYGNLDPADATQIQAKLSQQGVPFELRANGQEILVPADQVGRTRLLMAEEGLSGTLGYEIFDREESLGSSSFLQQVNHTRALEGELSRTIATFTSVKAARVHLVLPRRELFSRETQEPSASIILKMKGAQRLDRGQVLAVQHLVATAVQRLKPANISIVDDRGTLLARGGDENQGSADVVDMRSTYENRVRQKVEELLERTIGFGKVRVEVRAEMDFKQVVINKEEFNPEGQVLRSSEAIEESNQSSEAGDNTISVGNNLPDAPGGDEAAAGSREAASRTEERSNFEISKTLTNTIITPGEINRLSVAVLVDGNYTPAEPTGDEEVDENTPPTYAARTAEEMQQIETLVKSAMGYVEGRDTVEIVNMRFAEPPLTSADEIQTYFGLTGSDIKWLAQTLILGMLAILVILLVVRPLIGKLLEATPSAIETATGIGDPALLTDQSGMAMAGAGAEGGGGGGSALSPFDDEGGGDVESMIDIAHIEGRVKASSMRKIGEIIDKHPEEAVSILRNWIYQDAN